MRCSGCACSIVEKALLVIPDYRGQSGRNGLLRGENECGLCFTTWMNFLVACSPTPSHHPFRHVHSSSDFYTTMIKQRLSRSLQHLVRQQQQQCPRLNRTPFISTQSHRSLPPSISQRISGRRWYSQAQEAEVKKEEVAQEPAKEPALETAKDEVKEDPVQKELEAKKREVIDLTVRLNRPSQIRRLH
jgi:hypothetical protein